VDGMVAFFLPEKESAKVRAHVCLDDPVSSDAYHVTLAYLPALPERRVKELTGLVREFARVARPMTGKLDGVGCFSGEIVYVSVDVKGLHDFRQAFVHELETNQFKISTDHGFTPHITLGCGGPLPTIPVIPVEFEELSVVRERRVDRFRMGTGEFLRE